MCNFDENPEPWPCYDLVQKRFAGPEMVFCYQNCSYLLWEKIVLVIEKNFWNWRLKAENFQKFLRSVEQFIQTVKGQNKFLETECFFNPIPTSYGLNQPI